MCRWPAAPRPLGNADCADVVAFLLGFAVPAVLVVLPRFIGTSLGAVAGRRLAGGSQRCLGAARDVAATVSLALSTVVYPSAWSLIASACTPARVMSSAHARSSNETGSLCVIRISISRISSAELIRRRVQPIAAVREILSVSC